MSWLFAYLAVGAIVVLILNHLDPEADALNSMHEITIAIGFGVSWLLWPITLCVFLYRLSHPGGA